jgi:hypothetical protein
MLTVQAALKVFSLRFPNLPVFDFARGAPRHADLRARVLARASCPLPSDADLRAAGVHSYAAWARAPELAAPSLQLAAGEADAQAVWCAVDLACALRSEPSRKSAVRRAYAGFFSRSDDFEDGAPRRACLERVATDCLASLTDAAAAPPSLFEGRDGAVRTGDFLARLGPLLTAAALGVDPAPTLRRGCAAQEGPRALGLEGS